MIIFTNVRKSVDYKDFILQNVHPAEFYGKYVPTKICADVINDKETDPLSLFVVYLGL
jgi:hypothetical protein